MGGRKIPKEVQQIFDKYIKNNVRRLKKPQAIAMLKTEFNLGEEEASTMFDTFDKDRNGVMSMWEFQQFYQCVGNSATLMVEKFRELDKDGSGKLDADEARAGLKAMTTGTGRQLEDTEIDFFIKSTSNNDNVIDLGAFVALLFRLKLYKDPEKKPEKKKETEEQVAKEGEDPEKKPEENKAEAKEQIAKEGEQA